MTENIQKMLKYNILNHWKTVNLNNSETPSYLCNTTKIKNTAHNLCLRETPPLLLSFQKIRQQTIKLSYTSSGPIYKRCSTMPQGHMLNHVHSRITLPYIEFENNSNVSLLHIS